MIASSSVRRWTELTLALALGVAAPKPLGSQTATIVGTVAVASSNIAVGYAIVSASAGGLEQFTDAEGRFTMRGVPVGRVTISARHIGYTRADTTLTLAAGDTVRVRIEMSLVTIQLPTVRSLARACSHLGRSDPQVGMALAELFAQVRENAERNRLLSRSYPFEMDVERKLTRPEPALEARFIAFDTVIRTSAREWRYAPGKMVGTRVYTEGVFAGRWTTITMPELADFADARFLDAHCFEYGGADVVDGDTLLRIDFTPAPEIREPDVSGSIFLDPHTYQIRTTMLLLVNLDKAHRRTVSAQSIRADFREAIPGVPVVHQVSSVVFPNEDAKQPVYEPSTETHRTLSIRFLRGKP